MEQQVGLKKFATVDKDFHKNIEVIVGMGASPSEYIHHFSIYTGYVNLAKYLFFYDLYKKVIELSGHIADVGTWKGASFFYFAKLVRIFESANYTQVHGFDWFKGMVPDPLHDDVQQQGLYTCDYDTIVNLIQLQKLEDVAIIHKMDIVNELESFFADKQYMRFKLVFIDCGILKVLEKSLELFWPRLVKGGILVMDHYNCEASPSESKIVEKFIGDNYIKQVPFNRQPTGYVIKER